MKKLFSLLGQILAGLRRGETCADPLGRLSAREWADLPAYHPGCET